MIGHVGSAKTFMSTCFPLKSSRFGLNSGPTLKSRIEPHYARDFRTNISQLVQLGDYEKVLP